MMTELRQEQIEQIMPTLVRYWLADGQIVVFEAVGANRDTVDAWFDVTTETHQAWSYDEPHYEIHDMRQSTMTPYARAKALELGDLYVDMVGRSAIIVQDSHIGSFMTFFVNRVLNRLSKTCERRVFKDFDEGLAWIREGIQSS